MLLVKMAGRDALLVITPDSSSKLAGMAKPLLLLNNSTSNCLCKYDSLDTTTSALYLASPCIHLAVREHDVLALATLLR